METQTPDQLGETREFTGVIQDDGRIDTAEKEQSPTKRTVLS